MTLPDPQRSLPTATMSESTASLIARQPTWDGRPTTFSHFKAGMARYLVRAKVAFAVPKLNTTKYPTPASEPDVAIAFSQAYVYLSEAVSDTNRATIIADYDDVQREAFEPSDDDQEYADLLSNPDPVRLWDAFIAHAKGTVDLSGPQLHDRIQSWTWPATAGSGTYVDQVTTAISEIRELMHQAELIRDSDYPFSEALACRLFLTAMPRVFQSEYSSYEAIRKIHRLSTRALTDASRFDKLETVAPVSFGATVTTSVDQANAVQQLRALATQLGVSLPETSPGKITAQRRHDQFAGPPTPKHKWCDNHGWVFHSTSQCRAKPGSSGSAQSGSSKAAEYYVKNADGTFSKVAHAHVTFADAVVTMQAMGLSDGTSHVFVDTATDLSLSNSIESMTNVEVLDPLPRPCSSWYFQRRCSGASHSSGYSDVEVWYIHCLRAGLLRSCRKV